MSQGTLLQVGSFTADGENKRLAIRSDFDYIEVFNRTAAAQATADLGVKFTFQRGDTDGRGYLETKLGTVASDPLTVGQIAADSGFFLLDTSSNPVGAAVAVTATTDATTPTVSTGDTSGLKDGDVVRLVSVADVNSINGIDFQIDTIVANTSFDFAYAMANSPGTAGGAGFFRKVKYDPIFYPRRRFAANITQASSAVVTCTVDHGLTVGQEVRLQVPAAYGMVEMDGLQATITATTASTLTLDVDSSAFTAFAFPLPAAAPFSPALVIPVGMDTGVALSNSVDDLADATENQSIIGVDLIAGNSSPAGNTSDVIEWRAWKAFSVNNE